MPSQGKVKHVGAAVSLSLWIKLLKKLIHLHPLTSYTLSLSPSFWGRVVWVETLIILVGADTATTALHLKY